jgi:hypothetical protein
MRQSSLPLSRIITGQDPENYNRVLHTVFFITACSTKSIYTALFLFLTLVREIWAAVSSLLPPFAHLICGQDPGGKILRIYHRSNYFNNDYRPRPGDNDHHCLLDPRPTYICYFSTVFCFSTPSRSLRHDTSSPSRHSDTIPNI